MPMSSDDESSHEELLATLNRHGQQFLANFNGSIHFPSPSRDVITSEQTFGPSADSENQEDEEWQGISTDPAQPSGHSDVYSGSFVARTNVPNLTAQKKAFLVSISATAIFHSILHD